jgi:hypothetical protein
MKIAASRSTGVCISVHIYTRSAFGVSEVGTGYMIIGNLIRRDEISRVLALKSRGTEDWCFGRNEFYIPLTVESLVFILYLYTQNSEEDRSELYIASSPYLLLS